MKQITGYELSRRWFDFCFENPEKISPNHSAIYFFAIEHCNRLGWKEKFGFPTQMTMDAIGIKKHQTYIRYFSELCEWGFIKLVQKSTNQYSSNIISLVSAMPKNGKALDKAFITHAAKQTESMGQSTGQSNSSIDKQVNNKPINNKPINKRELIFPFNSNNFLSVWEVLKNQPKWKKKTSDALQASLKKLSNYSEAVAIQMMENTIAGGWQGLFEIKNNNNESGKKGFTRDGVQEALNRRLNELQQTRG